MKGIPASKEEKENVLKDERCECGNLVAKISDETVEIKCRRCKRIHIIPLAKLAVKTK